MARMIATMLVGCALVVPQSMARVAIFPPERVGPPVFIVGAPCVVTMDRIDGSGPGAPIPFDVLKLGAPVARTTISYQTGGSGTANLAIREQRKAAGLPYDPPTVDAEAAALPATFAVEPGQPKFYQRMLLVPSPRVALPYGSIFAQAGSATEGRIAALTLYLNHRPKARPRYRLTFIPFQKKDGCFPKTIDVYAPAMSSKAIDALFRNTSGCAWANLPGCTTPEERPHGQMLFVTKMYGEMYEYRWVDYDLLAQRDIARAGG